MVDSKSGAGNVKDELGLYCDTDKKKLLNFIRFDLEGFSRIRKSTLSDSYWPKMEQFRKLKKIIVTTDGNSKVHINYYTY